MDLDTLPTMPDEKMQKQIQFVAGLFLFLNIIFGVYLTYVDEQAESVTKLQLDIVGYGALLLGGLSFIIAFVCWFTRSGQKIERTPRYSIIKVPKLGLGTALFIFSILYFFMGVAATLNKFF